MACICVERKIDEYQVLWVALDFAMSEQDTTMLLGCRCCLGLRGACGQEPQRLSSPFSPTCLSTNCCGILRDRPNHVKRQSSSNLDYGFACELGVVMRIAHFFFGGDGFYRSRQEGVLLPVLLGVCREWSCRSWKRHKHPPNEERIASNCVLLPTFHGLQ